MPAREQLSALWQATPRVLRKVAAALVGAALILLALALIVLPGPFTLPLLVAGLAVLASEFPWAARALLRVRRRIADAAQTVRRFLRRLRAAD